MTSNRVGIPASACLLSALLLPAAIHLWGPLVVVALSPAAVVFCLGPGGWRLALIAGLSGLAASFLVQHTLWVVSIESIAILSLYQAVIWIPVAFGVRTLWRRWRVPLTLSWPIAWGAGEALRSLGPLGTTFGILTVPETTQPWMLQVADFGGYGLATLPLAMLPGWFADLYLGADRRSEAAGSTGSTVRTRILSGLKTSRFRFTTASVAAVWLVVTVYGHWRIDQIEGAMKEGPHIAVIQPDVVALPVELIGYDEILLLENLKNLSEAAVNSAHRPAVVVWPEGMFEETIPNRAFLEAPFDPRMTEFLIQPGDAVPDESILRERWKAVRREAAARTLAFREWVDSLGVPVIVGTEAWIPAPPERPAPGLNQNVAVRFDPLRGESGEFQAKVRLYPLGEYAPFRDTPIGPLLAAVTGPPKKELEPGDARNLYQLPSGGPSYVISLCSEMKFSHLSGTFPETEPNQKRFDFMINMANEGLFHRNGMLEIFAFGAELRAIENRVTVVRSSNAGISGFWSPTGKPYGQVTNDRGQTWTGLGAPELPLITDLLEFRAEHEAEFPRDPELRRELQRRIDEVTALREEAGIEGWSVQPIYLSDKITFFQRWGDWLTPTLITGLALMNLAGFIGHGRRRPNP